MNRPAESNSPVNASFETKRTRTAEKRWDAIVHHYPRFLLAAAFFLCAPALSAIPQGFEHKPVRFLGTQACSTGPGTAYVGTADALIPLSVLDALDLSTQTYDAAQGEVHVRHGGVDYVFTIGQTGVLKNGAAFPLDLAPELEGRAVLLPAKYLLSEFQASITLGDTLAIHAPTHVPHPTLAWTGELTVDGEPLDYQVQVATDPAFQHPVLSDTVAFTLQYVPSEPLPPGEYWWRVRPLAGGPPAPSWGEAHWFKVAQPGREYRVPAGADAKKIHEVIQEAARATPAVVRFDPGLYHVAPSFDGLQCQPHRSQYGGGVNPPCLIELLGVRNLVIDGNGATICIENEASFLKAFVSRNVTVRNFTVTSHFPLKPAARVVHADPQNSLLHVELLEGQVTPEEKPAYFSNFNEGFALTDASGATKRGVLTRAKHVRLPEKISDRTYRLTVAPFPKGQTFEQHIAEGDLLYFVPKQGAAYGALGLFAEYCEDLTFQNFRKMENGGYSYILKHCEKLKFLGFIDRPRSLLDHSEGGMIVSGRTGIWMDHCEFWNYSDDGPQNSTEPLEIESVPTPRTVILRPDTALRGSLQLPDLHFPVAQHWRTNDVRPGDTVFLYTNQVDPGGLRLTVQNVAARNGRIEVTLDRDIPADTPLEFKKPFPTGRTVLVNTSARQAGAAYRHCLFKNIARNGIYGAAARFLIEDCRFENIGETGLRVADFVPADCSHILIRRNHLSKTNLNCTAQEAISIGVLMYDRAHTWKNGMSDVFILQNRITDHNKVGCALWATQNVRICENLWENSDFPDFGFHCWGTLANETLQLRDCKNVHFENNWISDPRTRPAQFKVTGTEGFTESGNAFTPSSPK